MATAAAAVPSLEGERAVKAEPVMPEGLAAKRATTPAGGEVRLPAEQATEARLERRVVVVTAAEPAAAEARVRPQERREWEEWEREQEEREREEREREERERAGVAELAAVSVATAARAALVPRVAAEAVEEAAASSARKVRRVKTASVASST